jgi:hypothetical protein
MSKALAMGKVTRLMLYAALAAVTATGLCFGNGSRGDSHLSQWLGIQPASAQFRNSTDAWNQVYEQFPDLPRENDYISSETGEVNEDNTLVSRLVRYHMYVKSRPPNYRFDWKLTMADYLGAHELLNESQYPGANSLTENPMESDRAVIESLSRSERDALVNALVSVFTPDSEETANSTEPPASEPAASPAPSSPDSSTRRLITPEPGDAQLLKP